MNDNTYNTIRKIKDLEVTIIVDPTFVEYSINHSSIPYLIVSGLIAGSFISYWKKEITDKIATILEMIHSTSIEKVESIIGPNDKNRFESAKSIYRAIVEYTKFEFFDEEESFIKDSINRGIESVITILKSNKN